MSSRASRSKLYWRRAPHVALVRAVTSSHRLDGARPLEPEVREAAHLAAELARAQRLVDAAHRTRAAAEDARDRAERTRNAMEETDGSARRAHGALQEQLVFFEEQMRSTSFYLTEFVEPELLLLRAQRAELLHDVRLLTDELKARERAEVLRDLSAGRGMYGAPVRSDPIVRQVAVDEDLGRNRRWASGPG